MEYDDKESSGIVSVVSRQAGTVAGTSVVISKKIAGCGVKTVTAAKDLLKRPLKILTPARDKKNRTTSEAFTLESRDEQEEGRKDAAKALINALEWDLTAAERELEKVRNNAEKTQSELSSQLGELKAEKESLLSDLEQAKSEASEAAILEGEVKTRVTALESDLVATQVHLEKSRKEEEGAKSQPLSDLSDVQPEEKASVSDWGQEKVEVVSTEEKVESEMEPIVAQSAGELNAKMEERPSQRVSKVEVPSLPAVTEEQIQTAFFSNATDKVIFTRALSDMASQDIEVRTNAVKMIGGIRHKLSIKALVTQLACETSPRVRQECVKAFTRQEVNEGQGLRAIKRALTDQAASVRLAAVWGLYRLAGAESASDLVRMLSDEDEEIQRRSATCIGWLHQEELAVELLPLLSNPSACVRRAAIEAMGNLRSRRVISALIEHLNDPEKSIRKVILDTLKRITGKKMSGPVPRDEKTLQCCIARWREWWKGELLG
ncbi:MAG: HEAT repeat domain-containing protein [Candidatus Bathyarchaeota archaeon]|nr:MAG: HEAT repeat domain-containing protein [Candidatus Bathyarchaeota archaeon]